MSRKFKEAPGNYPRAEVWLFGSRAIPDAFGGDIDLLMSLGSAEPDFLALKIRLLRRLQDALGEQKIDIVIEREDFPPSAIHAIARQKGVLLWKNPRKS
ncbi:MAG: nucleotidyltransferase domain-containing protein [Elusimicrobia bacterium]|nr:nucleotidyltransferase domain-containing protein [Elusimicrobiota bacterium]